MTPAISAFTTTALRHSSTGLFRKNARAVHLTIKGISIVNGAQTTGAIGSLNRPPEDDLMVPIRFIWTTNQARVQEIIRFNNSQNKISASDFRSTDAVQKRLKSEFEKIPDAEYEGGRRGGASEYDQAPPQSPTVLYCRTSPSGFPR